MAIRSSKPAIAAVLATAGLLLALAGCGVAPAATAPEQRPQLGLMTSLPLYWQEDAELADIAAGRAVSPWQRRAIETRFVLVPLDTLTPLPALSPDASEVDPLAGLARLAVIQPRGLAPADNVALDAWVRAGGRLLLVLDPALTGEYASALGDPRRPVDAALIPPVVARWGLAIAFDETQAGEVTAAPVGKHAVPLVLAGRITITNPAAAQCTLLADAAAARCTIGQGTVLLIADAALFEHPELAGDEGARLLALLATAFD